MLTRPFITSVAIRLPSVVERHVVGRDDAAALGADRLDLAGVDVEGADLAAGHLRDVDAAVGAGAQTVGAEQPAGWGAALQGPPRLGDLRGVPWQQV